jgi:hypothetical protein
MLVAKPRHWLEQLPETLHEKLCGKVIEAFDAGLLRVPEHCACANGTSIRHAKRTGSTRTNGLVDDIPLSPNADAAHRSS